MTLPFSFHLSQIPAELRLRFFAVPSRLWRCELHNSIHTLTLSVPPPYKAVLLLELRVCIKECNIQSQISLSSQPIDIKMVVFRIYK